MTPENRQLLLRELRAWVLQCFTEFASRMDGVPPALTAAIDLIDGFEGAAGPRIAFAGRFSAGKTSLLNSVLGGRVLMEGMTETTAIPTRVRNGESERLLLKKSLDAWYEANERERQEFLGLRAAEMSPLTRRYLDQQEEVIFEHPLMPEGIEVVDLPGVSSSFQKVEERALQALMYANGVVWAANANQGGLTRSDLDYVSENVPDETPKLFVLTHMDLLPPSRRESVLDNARSSLKTVPSALGVVGTSRSVSLATSIELAPSWKNLLTLAQQNNRLLPLLQEVTGLLEGLQESMKQETADATHELIGAVGLSREAFEKYVAYLFSEYRQALMDLNSLVNSGEHVFGFHLNGDAVWQLCTQRMGKVYDRRNSTFERIAADFKRVRGEGAEGSESVLAALVSCWEWGASSFANNIAVAMQTAATIGWRFETPMANGGDIAGAMKEMWDWDTIKGMTCAPLLEGYDSVLENTIDALQEHHKLRQLYETGSLIVESEELIHELVAFAES